jgi:8-oxo-dGTP pyrophosphatase MutT (NUDIX family)
MDVRELGALVRGFEAPEDGAAMKSRELILAMLGGTESPLSRHQFMPGHVTATGLVLSSSGGRILLVHHARLERWLLPGGHVESEDRSAAEAARREVAEETGAVLDTGSAPVLIGLDVHGIPAKRGEPFHLHHDLVFGFRALSDAVECSPESRAVEWCAPAGFDRYDVPPNVRLAYFRFLAGQ